MSVRTKEPSFTTQPPGNAIEAVAGRLVVFPNDTEVYVSGSCVRVARNLYATARHVLTDYHGQFATAKDTVKATVWAIHVTPNKAYRIWQLDAAYLSGLSDLALFHTHPYDEVTLESVAHSPQLRLDPPSIGERVIGFGHHSPNASVTIGEDGTRHISIDTTGSATVGEVREVHHQRRDRSRLPFPCFQVNARFDGGMSGGPVFDDLGNLCGIVCSGMEPYAPEEEYVSYAATLWPLMGIMLNPSDDGRVQDRWYPAVELASRGVIHALGWQRVKIEPKGDPLTPTVHFLKGDSV